MAMKEQRRKKVVVVPAGGGGGGGGGGGIMALKKSMVRTEEEEHSQWWQYSRCSAPMQCINGSSGQALAVREFAKEADPRLLGYYLF